MNSNDKLAAHKPTVLHGPHGSMLFTSDGHAVKKNCAPPSWMFPEDSVPPCACHDHVDAVCPEHPAAPAPSEAVAEWIKSPHGNYPELKWREGYPAVIGQKFYARPQTEPVAPAAKLVVDLERSRSALTVAEALDLEPLRRMAEDWCDRASQHPDDADPDDEDEMRLHQIMAGAVAGCASELRRFIDQQAGKGVSMASDLEKAREMLGGHEYATMVGRDHAIATIVAALRAAPDTAVVPDEVLVLMNHLEDVLPDDIWESINVGTWNAVTALVSKNRRETTSPEQQAVPEDVRAREIRAIGTAVERAAEVLPEHWSIRIELECGSGIVYLTGPDEQETMINHSEAFSDQINEAIDSAIAAQPQGEEPAGLPPIDPPENPHA